MTYQREFTDRVKVGFVGAAGGHAYRNILPLLTFLPVDLVAVCDVDADKVAVIAKQYGVERVYTDTAQMYADGGLDAIIMCVSPFLHPTLAIQAFEAGLHVWMEKPAGARASEVAEAVDKQGDRICVVGLKKAFMPALSKVHEVMADPDHGPLRSMLAVYPMALPPEGAAALEVKQMTRWLADGCHPLAGMMAVGGPVAKVSTHSTPLGGGCTVLEFESGAIGNLHLADGSTRTQPWESYAFYGNDWKVEIENSTRVKVERGIPFDYNGTTSFVTPGFDSGAVVWEAQNSLNTLENKATFVQGIYGSLLHFLQGVLGDAPVTTGTLAFALEVTKVYEAVLVAMDGTTVEMANV